MLDSSLDLSGARNISTTPYGLTLKSIGLVTAYRTGIRNMEWACPLRAFFFNNFHNFWYNISCPFNQNRIPDADIFSFYLILVVKRCICNGYTCNKNGFKFCNRG